MGLFGRKKAKSSQSSNSDMSEFDRDIMNLLARDDIQCREDACEAEFRKAKDLLENPTQEKLRRAYDLMGNLASQFEYVPAILWMGDFCENVLKDDSRAVSWYRKAAELGDGQGARCYADMLMAGKGVARDMNLALEYYAAAANKGVPEAAFVMGEYFRNCGEMEFALKAYRVAYQGGYAPAKMRIDQMTRSR